jgi:hypothetical protein
MKPHLRIAPSAHASSVTGSTAGHSSVGKCAYIGRYLGFCGLWSYTRHDQR